METAYEGELQFLCRICVLDGELTKSLTDTVTCILVNFVELVVREIEFIAHATIGPEPFARPGHFS